jgi:hypothetical protein
LSPVNPNASVKEPQNFAITATDALVEARATERLARVLRWA